MYLQAKNNTLIRKKKRSPCLVKDMGGKEFLLKVLCAWVSTEACDLCKVQIDPVYAIEAICIGKKCCARNLGNSSQYLPTIIEWHLLLKLHLLIPQRVVMLLLC